MAITGLNRPVTYYNPSTLLNAPASSALTLQIADSRETGVQQTTLTSSTVLILEWCCDAAALALTPPTLEGTKTVDGYLNTFTYFNYEGKIGLPLVFTPNCTGFLSHSIPVLTIPATKNTGPGNIFVAEVIDPSGI